MKKTLNILLIIFVLAICFCNEKKDKEDNEDLNTKSKEIIVTVKGKLKVVGSSPLIKLVLDSEDGHEYYLPPKLNTKYKRLNYFGKKVAISGESWYKILKTPDGKTNLKKYFLKPNVIFVIE